MPHLVLLSEAKVIRLPPEEQRAGLEYLKSQYASAVAFITVTGLDTL